MAENTIASFARALQLGATGLEFDVRRCGDGRLVVIHDETIDRTTNGHGRVDELSYEELRQFNAGSGEVIPLLVDVLDGFGAAWFRMSSAIFARALHRASSSWNTRCVTRYEMTP